MLITFAWRLLEHFYRNSLRLSILHSESRQNFSMSQKVPFSIIFIMSFCLEKKYFLYFLLFLVAKNEALKKGPFFCMNILIKKVIFLTKTTFFLYLSCDKKEPPKFENLVFSKIFPWKKVLWKVKKNTFLKQNPH